MIEMKLNPNPLTESELEYYLAAMDSEIAAKWHQFIIPYGTENHLQEICRLALEKLKEEKSDEA